MIAKIHMRLLLTAAVAMLACDGNRSSSPPSAHDAAASGGNVSGGSPVDSAVDDGTLGGCSCPPRRLDVRLPAGVCLCNSREQPDYPGSLGRSE